MAAKIYCAMKLQVDIVIKHFVIDVLLFQHSLIFFWITHNAIPLPLLVVLALVPNRIHAEFITQIPISE